MEVATTSAAMSKMQKSLDDEMRTELAVYIKSKDKFPVDFDKVWQWIGYSRKDSAKRSLESYFRKGIDYRSTTVVNSEISQHGGQNREQIMMTTFCFKAFCMVSATKKAKLVHKYYLDIEHAYTLDHKESKIVYDNLNLHKAFHEPFASKHKLHETIECEDTIEKQVADELAHKLNGKREVLIECGRMDIATNDEVIEVKIAHNWKHALGQVLAYASETNLKPRIHLIGDVPNIAYTICKKFNVEISMQ